MDKKSFVEQLSNEQMEQINRALREGRKIEAIKLFRKFTGLGLADAKEFIDVLSQELKQKYPDEFAQKQGCLVLFAAFIIFDYILKTLVF